MDIHALVVHIIAILPTIVAIGWSLEKILKLIDNITPPSWHWDNDIADILSKILKAIGGKANKND